VTRCGRLIRDPATADSSSASLGNAAATEHGEEVASVSFKDPKAITEAGTAKGAEKARIAPGKMVVAGFLAGAYIGFGGLLAISVSAGLDPATWGTLPTLFTGAVFTVGLMLVVIAGSELLTGNMALVPLAAMRGRANLGQLTQNFFWVILGNLLGSLFVAYFLAVETGVVTGEMQLARLESIAMAKGVEETEWQIFLRALGCNWLVCLAVWMAMAAEDIAGKILAIFFPIMAFVAMGFDHVVANMFFLPAAIFAGLDLTWWDAIHNWIFAFLGNLVGASIFVAGAYWYLYGRPAEQRPGRTMPGDQPHETGRLPEQEQERELAGRR
jgi:formate/nitrite transporter